MQIYVNNLNLRAIAKNLLKETTLFEGKSYREVEVLIQPDIIATITGVMVENQEIPSLIPFMGDVLIQTMVTPDPQKFGKQAIFATLLINPSVDGSPSWQVALAEKPEIVVTPEPPVEVSE